MTKPVQYELKECVASAADHSLDTRIVDAVYGNGTGSKLYRANNELRGTVINPLLTHVLMDLGFFSDLAARRLH